MAFLASVRVDVGAVGMSARVFKVFDRQMDLKIVATTAEQTLQNGPATSWCGDLCGGRRRCGGWPISKEGKWAWRAASVLPGIFLEKGAVEVGFLGSSFVKMASKEVSY